jgi:predicted dehydrogenase
VTSAETTFGLVGTGPWAASTHGPGIAAATGVELACCWGRDRARTAALAGQLGVRACTSVDELFERVDAVAFAVPPEVQVELAVRAAEAGCHLLLEKPIATDVAAAGRLVAAVDGAGVASVVFFTARFDPVTRAWLSAVDHRYEGGFARFISGADPGASSPWRREKGALWDLCPHLLALVIPALGSVGEVVAAAGSGDLVHLVLAHEGGATSTLSCTLQAPPAAAQISVELWGRAGVERAPTWPGDPARLIGVAATELAAVGRGEAGPHPCDVHFGEVVVEVLARAEASLGRVGAAGSGR